jgi:exopolyphosphatase/guanosine-5'-triphosphate,3'-diphosphate pyrophosphatase
MRVAAIDLGSNSFLCLIAEKDQNGQLKEIYDTIEFVKLGEGVHKNKAFSEDALQRAEITFQKFQKLIQEYKVEKVDSVATSAARDVSNKQRFFDLGQKYNIPINVISGESEGDYTFLGVLSARPKNPNFSVLDIGGGSTEIAFKKDNRMKAKSYNVGCVRLTELFLESNPEKDSEISEFRRYLKERMPTIDHNGLEMVAVAGTPTTLASLYLQKEYNPELIEGFQLKKNHVQELIQKLQSLTIEERKKLVGIDAPRADVIMAGALILEHVMNIADLAHVVVSTRGVRYGLAYKMLGCHP